MHARRRFEMAQMTHAKAEQFAFIAAHPVSQNCECHDILADIPVGHAHCRSLQHRRMGFENFVDLLGRDIHPAFDNQLLRAADDEEIAVLIPVGEITGMQPAFGIQRQRRSRFILVIALHHPVAAQQYLARLAGGQFNAVTIDDPGLKPPWQAGGPNFVGTRRNGV